MIPPRVIFKTRSVIKMDNDIQNRQEKNLLNEAIEDLKKREAVIIECPRCEKETFIGVSQAYTSDDRPYPLGSCCCCDINLKALDDKTDVQLMMEFRGMYWNKWVLFCMERNYKPVVLG